MMFTQLEWLRFGASSAMGIFTGGALYINAVEHYSRRTLPVKSQREEFANSFNSASKFLPSFGLVGSSCATALYFLSSSELRCLWLVGPVSFVLGGAFTVMFMLPEINHLLEPSVVEKKGENWVRAAIDRWNYRHMFRTVLDGSVFFLYMYLTIKAQ